MVAMATCDQKALPCHMMGFSPISVSNTLMAPILSEKICEKMMPAALGATMYGNSTPMRQKVFALRFALRIHARNSARMICGTELRMKMEKELRSASQKDCWCSTQLKLAQMLGSSLLQVAPQMATPPSPVRVLYWRVAIYTVNSSGNRPTTANSRKNGAI